MRKLALIMAVALLTACTAKQGIVIDKMNTAGSTGTAVGLTPNINGGVSTTVGIVTSSPRWTLVIRGTVTNKVYTMDVSQQTYYDVEIGDYVQNREAARRNAKHP